MFAFTIEVCRISLGYAGNLCERVPHLFGFLFLTLFPQLILLSLFLCFEWNNKYKNCMDRAVSALQILFALSQLIFGSIAIKHVIHAQTLKFKLKTRQRHKLKQQKLFGNNTNDTLQIDQNDLRKEE